MSNPNLEKESDPISSYDFDKEMTSFLDILLILARNLKIILIVPILLCLVTIIQVQFFAKPVFVSYSKVKSSSSNNNTSQAAGLAAQFGISMGIGQGESNWVYEDIIKSRVLAKAMLKRRFDTNKFGSKKSLLQILSYGNREPKSGLDTLEIIAAEKFLEMIKVSSDLQTGIYTIFLSAFEPHLAFKLNEALIEELDSHQQKYNKAITSEARQFIEERIIETKKELESAEEMLKDFAKRNRRIENSPLLLLEQQRLSREVSVLTGVYTTLKQQLEKTKIEEVKESNYVIVLDPPVVPLVRSKPNKKRMVILAGLLGIGLGIGIAFFRDYLNNSEQKEKLKIKQAKILISKNLSELLLGKSKKNN